MTATNKDYSELEPTEETLDFVQAMSDEHHPYHHLARTLALAYEQAAKGKGKERHASEGEPFHEQQIVRLGEWLGSNHFEIGQASKKGLESVRLPKERGMAELLGAINYLAAAHILRSREPAGEASEAQNVARVAAENAELKKQLTDIVEVCVDDGGAPRGLSAIAAVEWLIAQSRMQNEWVVAAANHTNELRAQAVEVLELAKAAGSPSGMTLSSAVSWLNARRLAAENDLERANEDNNKLRHKIIRARENALGAGAPDEELIEQVNWLIKMMYKLEHAQKPHEGHNLSCGHSNQRCAKE